MILLTSDWHLTDNPADEYRWNIFTEVEKAIDQHDVRRIFILGDVCDRKDRHSGALVNRLVQELIALAKHTSITILKGNHDAPLRGEPYWSFLSAITGLRFITKPTAMNDLLLLPHSTNPKEQWADLAFKSYRCIMMHQTVHGVIEAGRALDPDAGMIKLPSNLIAYSGDIHTPQQIGPVTYVGAPHPVKFGDTYPCRMLLLDDKYRVEQAIKLRPPRKAIMEVSSLKELQTAKLTRGDQVQIRYSLKPEQMAGYPVEQDAIHEWARTQGISIASIEATVKMGAPSTIPDERGIPLEDPYDIVRAFATADGIDNERMLEMGITLVREYLDNVN
jgi:DNA repair exonuclease SbcCD nuclease subunit